MSQIDGRVVTLPFEGAVIGANKIVRGNDGAVSVEDSGVTITDDADVGIDDSTPNAKLHVDQKGSSRAIPVLLLDQADVSEEMIEFVSTIGTGNAIEAVGAKSLTTTHFIKVTIPGGLTRYIECGTIA